MEIKNLRDRIVQKLTGIVGYLLPLMSSLPPLAAWSGLMTVPFIVYLMLMFGNISVAPPTLPDYTRLENWVVLIVAALGFVLLLYSVIHLWRTKTGGLVTTGPYRFVRHPQYFALIIFTTMMTYPSVWILRNTFGMGWLSADQTLVLWYATLFAYVAIAWIEEAHLDNTFGDEWKDYRQRVGFLIPLVRFRSNLVEGLLCALIPIVIMQILLGLPVIL
ncbi:MAG: methyltransferase family protein [Candidatus Thorarchaeota archaeon]